MNGAVRALARLDGGLRRWAERLSFLPAGLFGAVALVLVAAFAYAPLFGGPFISADTLHAMRIYELNKCLDDGQVPCRWVPDLGNGYGFPLFNYYPPLPYYVGAMLEQVGLSYLRTVDLLFGIGLVAAGLSMYVLARRLWGDLGGLVSAVAFVFAPYLALDIYLRGALAELWALAATPLLLWAVYELATTGRARLVPVAALAGALLLLAHNLVVVIMAPLLVLWTVVLLLSRGVAGARAALLCALAAVWALGLAAFFTLPALTEGDLVQLEHLARWPFFYGDHFASLNDLFFLRTADYSFLGGGRDSTPTQIGWFHWALAGLSAPAALVLARRGRRREAALVCVFAALFGAGVFMSVPRSRFVWDAFDSLRFLQFPWRYLGLVSLAAAGLAGAWLGALRGWPLLARLALAAALIGLFAGSGRTFFQPYLRCADTEGTEIFCAESDAEYFEPAQLADRQAGVIYDYLPAAVETVPELREEPARVVEGDARIVAASSGTDSLDLRIDAEQPSRIEAGLFDFPDWRVRVDGEAVPHQAAPPHGLVTFQVPAGRHTVEIELEDTGIRRLGNALSIVAWAALALAGLGIAVTPGVTRLRARNGEREV